MSTSTSSTTVVFKFNDGTTLDAEPDLVQLSTEIEKTSKSEKKEIELPERFIGEAFNAFAKFFFPKYSSQLEKLEESIDKEDWWMEFIADNQEATGPVKGLYQDDLIRAGNAASDVEFPAFVHACAYVMAEQTENMKLKDLREYLNEDYDFPDEIKKKIEACPEFKDL